MPHIIWVSVPDITVARKLASGILQNRLAACVNLVPGVESHYWWGNKLCAEAEILMAIKTTREQLAALEAYVLAEHPYDTPEYIALEITAGNSQYLDWVASSVGSAPL